MSRDIRLFADLFKGNPTKFGKLTDNGWTSVGRDEVSLNNHFSGKYCIGVYPIRDNHTKFLCFDIDGKDSQTLYGFGFLVGILIYLGITLHHFLIEFSGQKGYHLWVFFEEWISSDKAYKLGVIAQKLAKMKCEIFPKQPTTDGLGNLVKLPLGTHPVTGKHCSLTRYDLEPLEMDKQWEAMKNVKKVTEEMVDRILEKYSNLIKTRQNLGLKNNEELYEYHAIKQRLYAFPCLKDIYLNGVQNGNRNMATLRLASQLYHSGFKQSVIKKSLNRWNEERNSNPLPSEEIERTVNSVFARAYIFGCSDPFLQLYCKSDCRIKKYRGKNDIQPK